MLGPPTRWFRTLIGPLHGNGLRRLGPKVRNSSFLYRESFGPSPKPSPTHEPAPMNPTLKGKPSPMRPTPWKDLRGRINLTALATELLGPPPGRRGERGSRSWWRCPFHDDNNPSFSVDAVRGTWHCFGCGQHGDAAGLVMRLEGLDFPSAVRRLGGDRPPSRKASPPRPRPEPAQTAPGGTSGLTREVAERVASDAVAMLWSAAGRSAMAYLREHRFLDDETIRRARLGVVRDLEIPRPDKPSFHLSGVVIPWRDPRGRLAKINIRQRDGVKPKYASAFENRDILARTAFSLDAIRPGRPLVVTEGEFDCILLSQEIGDQTNVISMGSASIRPGSALRLELLKAHPRIIATDADPAGDKAAQHWPGRPRRVRPPQGKDWTDARTAGCDLREFWLPLLSPIAAAPDLVVAAAPPDDVAHDLVMAELPAKLPAPLVGEDPWAGGRWSADGKSWTADGFEWLPVVLNGIVD